MFKKKLKVELKDNITPFGIEKVEGGYRVKGRMSIHPKLEAAVKQKKGMKNVK